MESRPNLDLIFLQDIFYKLKSTLTLWVTKRNTCGTCKAQLFLPLYDLHDNKVLICTKYMVPIPNKGKMAQHGRKFCGGCKDEEIQAYSSITELHAACSF